MNLRHQKLRLRRSKAVGGLFIAKSKIVVNVGTISTKHGVRMDRNVIAELLYHSGELGIVEQVSVTPVETDKVLAL